MEDAKISVPVVTSLDGQVISGELNLPLSYTKEGERRIAEAQMVNPITYSELEHTFNAAYRELKRNYAAITFQKDRADKKLEEIKSGIILEDYPKFLESKPKSYDNAETRKALIAKNEDYKKCLDRINELKMLEKLIDGKIKSFERVCAYMKKQMDLILRSGLSSRDLYTTGNKNE